MTKAQELYHIFESLFPSKAEFAKSYKALDKNAILIETINGTFYRFEFKDPKNYILQKGKNKYEVSKPLFQTRK